MFTDKPPDHSQAISRKLRCGNCQWFSSGFEGNDCRRIRGVEPATTACREYQAVLEDPYHEVANDKYLMGIRNKLYLPKFKINEAAILQELSKYIIDENLNRFTYGSDQDIAGIDMANRKIVSYRARVSSIYTSMIDLKYEVAELHEHASLWLFSKYETMRELKNEGLRKAAFGRILPEFIEIETTVNKVMDTAKYIDDKLDANERIFRSILQSAERLWFSKGK